MAVCSSLSRITISLCALVTGAVQGADDIAALEDLVVSASRNALPANRIGSAVTVITREDLEARQLPYVADVLRDVPGLTVSRAGGLGGITQVRIRGAEGNHTLVLIDGVEANNPVSGSEFDFAHLSSADVERIEILRGAQSALYGSDAIGGVINILTRSADGGSELDVRAGGGSLGTSELAVRLSGGDERRFGSLSVSRFRTAGNSVAVGGLEEDGHNNLTAGARGTVIINDRLRIQASWRGSESETDSDDFDFVFPATPTQGLLIDSNDRAAFRESLGQLQVELESPEGAWLHRLQVGHSSSATTFSADGLFNSTSQGERLRVGYQTSASLADRQRLTLAVEHEALDYSNQGASALALENQRQSTDQTSGIAEYQIGLGRTDLSASLRHDSNQRFDNATTYRLTASIALKNTVRFHASAGSGVTNPGFFELFGFFPSSFVGNPDIKPEKANSFDAGVEAGLFDDRLTLDVTLFKANLQNEIATVFDFTDFTSKAVNLEGDSHRSGAEVALRADFSPWWQLNASYTYTDTEQPDGRSELRRPRHVAAFDNTLQFYGGRGRLHLGVDFNGAQEDLELVFATPSDRVRLGSFTLVHAAGDWAVSDRWRLYGRVENLLNRDYQEQFAYAGRGRTFLAGFELRLR
jgi:vitamin B12 transporter